VVSVSVRLASRIQSRLQELGYEVSRHASSMLVFSNGFLVATLHVYGDSCKLSLYRLWGSRVAEAQDALRSMLARECSRLLVLDAPREPLSAAL